MRSLRLLICPKTAIHRCQLFLPDFVDPMMSEIATQISYAPLAMDESTAPSPIKEARAYSEMEDEPLDELNSLLDADMPVTPVFSFKRSPNKRPKRLMLQEEEPSSDEETESVRPRNPQTIRQAPDRRHTADNRKRRKTYNHEKTNKLHQLLSRFRDDPTCSNAVQELVEDGADPDCLCAAGNRPLHYAAYHKRIPLIRSLIDHGAGAYELCFVWYSAFSHQAVFLSRLQRAECGRREHIILGGTWWGGFCSLPSWYGYILCSHDKRVNLFTKIMECRSKFKMIRWSE